MKANGRKVQRKDFTLKEAAYEISMSYAWLRQRIGKKGGPPVKRRGHNFLFPRKEFMDWANQPEIK